METGRTGGLKDGSAPVYDSGNIGGGQWSEVCLNKAFVAPHDADSLQIEVRSSPYDSAKTGIHARRITAGSQHTDFPYMCSFGHSRFA
jgi:hypothetical protein